MTKKWTKQRIASVGVLAAAAVAFVVDRGLQARDAGAPAGGGAPASVVARHAGDGADARSGSTADAGAATGQPLAALARQLTDVAAAEAVAPGTAADAFRPPAEWFGAARQATVVEGAPTADGADEFLANHKLTAVMRGGGRPDQGIAVIRGRPLRVGQSIGGFTLTAVHDDWVSLTDRRNGQVRLYLPKPDLAASH